MDFNGFLSKFEAVKGSGNQYQAKCPVHDDNTASLSIGLRDGNILLHCQAGCNNKDIVSAIGLKMSDLFSKPLQQQPTRKRTSSTLENETYNYSNVDGEPLYRVKRYVKDDKKCFCQEQYKDGQYIKGMDGVSRVLYKLPDIAAAGLENNIYIVEGEKDADTLAKMGFVATCNTCGAGKWRDDYNQYLIGKQCIILPDNDPPGRDHAEQVARSLYNSGIICKVLQLPNLPDKGDVSDWIEQGGNMATLVAIAAKCTPWKPEQTPTAEPETPETRPEYVAKAPITQAEYLINKRFTHQEHTIIKRWRDEWYIWDGTHYKTVKTEIIRAKVYTTFKKVYESDFKLNKAKVTDIIDALPACKGVIIRDDDEPPIVPGNTISGQLLTFKNGILDIESMRFIPHTPAIFNTSALPYDYDPNAPEPEAWNEFLYSIWDEDVLSIDFLRQWFAYCLTNKADKQKIMLLIGPMRSGKGTIAKVLTELLGVGNIANPTLTSLYSQFGLEPLIDKKLAIIPDARLSGRSDQAVIVERLLSISGGDRLVIDRKHKQPLPNIELKCKMMMVTNELPYLADAAGALASRFAPLEMNKSFLGNEDYKLYEKLKNELPGILNWALEGLNLLDMPFIEPEASKEINAEFRKLTSPIQAFVEDYCELDPSCQISKDELHKGYLKWAENQGYIRPKTKSIFSKDLLAAYRSQVKASKATLDSTRTPVYVGVKFKANISPLDF